MSAFVAFIILTVIWFVALAAGPGLDFIQSGYKDRLAALFTGIITVIYLIALVGLAAV